MKVEIKNIESESEIKYPCLMKSTSGRIILFAEPKCGTILSDPTEAPYPVGYYNDSWTTVLFTPLPSGSKVTLTQ